MKINISRRHVLRKFSLLTFSPSYTFVCSVDPGRQEVYLQVDQCRSLSIWGRSWSIRGQSLQYKAALCQSRPIQVYLRSIQVDQLIDWSLSITTRSISVALLNPYQSKVDPSQSEIDRSPSKSIQGWFRSNRGQSKSIRGRSEVILILDRLGSIWIQIDQPKSRVATEIDRSTDQPST